MIVLTCRGISYDKLGDRRAAIADFTSAVVLDPSNLGAYFNRGTAYDALGMHKEATVDFARALDLDFAPARQPHCSVDAAAPVKDDNTAC